jgi:hypothetical protein
VCDTVPSTTVARSLEWPCGVLLAQAEGLQLLLLRSAVTMTTMTHGGRSSSYHCRPHLLQEEEVGHRHHTRKQVQASNHTNTIVTAALRILRAYNATRASRFLSIHLRSNTPQCSVSPRLQLNRSSMHLGLCKHALACTRRFRCVCDALRTSIHTVCFALRCWCDHLANAHASLGHAWPALSTLGQHWWAMASSGMSWLALVFAVRHRDSRA